MRPFVHSQPRGRIVFGPGSFDRLGAEAELLGLARVLLISSGSSKALGDHAAQLLAARVAVRIGEVSEVVSTINASVDQQNAATREIAQSAQNVSRGTAETSDVIEGVRASAEETGHSASEVSEAARGLLSLSQRLKDDVDRFLKTLLAA